MAAFKRFGSACFSEHLKVAAAFFIKQLYYFLPRNIFIQRITQKTRTFILISMMNENSIIAFRHVFMVTFYADTLQKLFFTNKT